MTNQAAYIINKFGGIRPLSRMAALAPSTVQYWTESGLIPAKHQKRLLELGSELGINISPVDFFDFPAETIAKTTQSDKPLHVAKKQRKAARG